jgi:pSer/pThr/pTyr-binding forkhead associated (FHA) protein
LPNTFEDPTRPEAAGEVSDLHVRLVFLWHGGGASYILGPGATLTVGRSSECGAPIDHPSVSRMHAVVHGGNPAYIEDLGSSNGVRVRGVRIEPRMPTSFSVGDVVELGSVVLVLQAPTNATAQEAAARAEGMDAVGRLVDLVAKSDISVLL